MNENTDTMMRAAISEADEAYRRNEVPVGALVVMGGRVVGRGRNSVIGLQDPTAHAEMMALREAGKTVGNYRLTGAELYVTLEPCLMCYSAMVHARIGRLVYSARDEKTGVFSTGSFERVRGVYNHEIAVESGVLENQTAKTLRKFFIERRDAGAVERDGLENR